MEKMKMHTPDLTQDNIAKLAALFPNCVTEARDAQGKLKKAVDFDQLRQELSGVIVEGPQERYRLDWPGKREALLAANAPIAKTLRPCREESVDFDTTKNLFIEGDNLEALKLLQETYLGKVKIVYIDPPYNTGNDFLYKDDFSRNSSEYFGHSNQTDALGNRLISNTESNGRFHSDWLSMLYPRLKLTRNLLRDDAVIFISIDDNELTNLRKMCDEIFGEENFIATIVWQKRYVSNVTAQWISDMHDYIVIYSKSKNEVKFRHWDRTEEQIAAYKNPDNDPRGDWRAQDLSASKPYSAGQFEITGPTGRVFSPPPNRFWRCNQEQFNKWVKDGRIWWGTNQDARPMLKSFLAESERGITPHTWWDHSFAGHNKEATLELKDLFNGDAPFDTPKPVKLMSRLIQLIGDANSIVLDFFSGSGTLAHGVMQANAEDGGQRKFILVQIPVPYDENTSTHKKGFHTISDTGKERIRRAGVKIKESNPILGSNIDFGFRVLKIENSNMEPVFYSPDSVKQESLLAHIDNIRPGRTSEDLLFQVLLDWGVDLALPIQRESLAGKEVFFVDETALAACFEGGIDEEFVKALAKRKPLRVVFRDAGFADDAVKINVGQIFKSLSPDTEVKVI